MSLRNFDFSYSTFWIQIHYLPLQFMSKENAFKIGSCEDITRKSTMGMKFMILQVEIDISKPFSTRFFQEIGKGKTWIQFCYERMGDFCYNCGVIGHLKNSCKLSENTSLEKEGNAFGV